MKKKTGILICLCIVLVVALAGGIYYYVAHHSSSTAVEGGMVELDEEQHTHGVVFFMDMDIDTLMLGKWQHQTDTTWYRVYTSEPAGEDFYWGREWNESEDIFEEDLMPYGNGWFKWKKTDKEVIEWHMTDNSSATIPFEYKILDLDNMEMRYREKNDGAKQKFSKCEG